MSAGKGTVMAPYLCPHPCSLYSSPLIFEVPSDHQRIRAGRENHQKSSHSTNAYCSPHQALFIALEGTESTLQVHPASTSLISDQADLFYG